MTRFLLLSLVACSTPAGKPQPYRAAEGVVGGGSGSGSGSAVVADPINVNVTGLRSNDGTVRCFLYDSADGFPDTATHVIAKAVALIKDKAATCKFAGVPRDKDYAIVMLHDENNDNVFQKGPFGIPKEGYGFSNNAKARFSAPSFDDCKFRATPGEMTLALTMQY